MKAIIDSLIRTRVPGLVAGLAVYLTGKYGIEVPSDVVVGVTVLAVFVTETVYYGVIRVAEKRWPSAGWLLGKPGAPTYGDLDGAERG